MRRQQRRALERKEAKMNNRPILLDPNHKEIVGDDALREKKCLAEIAEVLERFDCLLIPHMVPQIKVTAKPRVLNG